MDNFILIELIMTVFVYLVFPVVYVKNNGRQELGVAKKIAFWNSVVCAGIFMIIRLAVSGGELVGVSVSVAVFYYFINKGILREREDSIEGKLKEQKRELLQQQEDPYFKKRYNLEYQLIRNIAFLMDEEMEKIFFDKQSLSQFLYENYSDIDGNIKQEDFEVVYPNNNIVLIRLPHTTITGLCNMIGIAKCDKTNRFFAFTSHATEWMQDGQRQHFDFDVDSIEEFSVFVLEMCGQKAEQAVQAAQSVEEKIDEELIEIKEGNIMKNINEIKVIEMKKTGYGFEEKNPIMIVGANHIYNLISNLRIKREGVVLSSPQIRGISSLEVEGFYGPVDDVAVEFLVRTEDGQVFFEKYHIFICGYKPAENKEDMLMKMINLDMQEFEIPEEFSYFRPNPNVLRNLDEI